MTEFDGRMREREREREEEEEEQLCFPRDSVKDDWQGYQQHGKHTRNRKGRTKESRRLLNEPG